MPRYEVAAATIHVVHQAVKGRRARHGHLSKPVGVVQLLLKLGKHDRRRAAARFSEDLLDGRDDARVGVGTWRLRPAGKPGRTRG
jgi:hypothetical protein